MKFENVLKRKKMFYLLVAICFMLLLLSLFLAGIKFMTCQHQKSTMIELKQWHDEYEGVKSKDDAFHSIEYYEYVSGYYVADKEDGYYCSKKMSIKLESQRKKFLSTIVKELENYTGLKYGHDLQKWKDWIKIEKAKEQQEN